MNREIKFRAWCTERRKYLTNSSEVHIEINSPFVFKFNPLNNAYYASDKIIIQQYTGLKDKNGKEIYEGDICKRYHLQGIVSYHTERAMFIIQDGFNEPLYQEIYGVEVIGNIYENPELTPE